MNERKIEEYTVLRGVVTVLVVIGHSIVIKSATQYGGYDYSVIGSTNRLCLKLFMIRLLDIESSRYTFKPLFLWNMVWVYSTILFKNNWLNCGCTLGCSNYEKIQD